MKQVNTIIVGQGIAGSLVAFMLYRQNISFVVIDAGYSNTASRIAAGMFTPISGKRNTLNTLMIEQIPFAIDIYRQIEKLLGQKILHSQNVYQLPESIKQKKDLINKSEKEECKKYITSGADYLPGIRQEFGAMEITNSGWVDCPLFINSFTDWLKQKDAFMQEEFNYTELQIHNANLNYKHIVSKNIIFCEGYRSASNPFFNNETIIPCKGDILTVEYKNAPFNHIIKKSACYLIPLGTNIFKAGSTYQWNNNTGTLEDGNKNEIEVKLDAILETEYKIINHQTAIRPTTIDRDVIAKQHLIHPNFYILNGLGTKGVIQGPWWADYIVKLLQTSPEK